MSAAASKSSCLAAAILAFDPLERGHERKGIKGKMQLPALREALWSRVGNGAEWVHQGMRHTFCSCWLAQHQDVNKLLLMTGHTSPQMLWRNYYRAVEKAEAEKFWSIFPPEALKT